MRRDHENQIGVRLAVAAGGAVVLLIPFAVVAAMVVGQPGWLHRSDERITDSLHEFAAGHPGWVEFMRVWSFVFDPNVWRLAALGLVVWLVRRGLKGMAAWVAVTIAAGGLLNALLKVIFGRARPEFLDPVAQAAGYSFPSGHALNNAVGAAVFLLVLLPLVRGWRRVLLWAAAIVVPFVTGLSRVFLGVHWTSDVVGGWLLGVAVVALTATAYLSRRRRSKPVAAEGLEPEVARQA